MSRRTSDPDLESLLSLASEASRDGLRHCLRSVFTDDSIRARTWGSIGGGTLTHSLTMQLLSTGTMPTSAQMSGLGDDSWPREFFELIRWGDSYAPWQCLAAWVLLTWVADPADDQISDADTDTVWSLTEAASRISPEVCARAIAYLRWQALARNDPGPTVFHELGITCLYAAMLRECPGSTLRDALDAQCLRLISVAEQDMLDAIDSCEIWTLRWPLDMESYTMNKKWRKLCDELLHSTDSQQMPASVQEILRRLHDDV